MVLSIWQIFVSNLLNIRYFIILVSKIKAHAIKYVFHQKRLKAINLVKPITTSIQVRANLKTHIPTYVYLYCIYKYVHMYMCLYITHTLCCQSTEPIIQLHNYFACTQFVLFTTQLSICLNPHKTTMSCMQRQPYDRCDIAVLRHFLSIGCIASILVPSKYCHTRFSCHICLFTRYVCICKYNM